MLFPTFRNSFLKNNPYIKEILHKSWNYHMKTSILRKLSHKSNITVKCKSDMEIDSPFTEMITKRRCQAKRSILVQVQSAQSFKELHNYCSNYGHIKQMIHYTTGLEPLHFIIVEFSDYCEVQNILKTSCYNEDTQAVPVNSTFLWFRAARKNKGLKSSSSTPVLDIEDGNKKIKEEELKQSLQNAENITDQVNLIYEKTKLNDTGTRLRFLTANQIEQSISGMFPNAIALPFGSSVNGYGKMGCDLDLALKWNSSLEDWPDSRLVFQCKAATGTERSQSQRHMETLGDLIQIFVPGCIQVRRILQARVPIIKYNQQLTDVECDLSMTNMTGVHMSELLNIWGSIDERVRPLVFVVRKWAYETGLTSSSPGRWITNFSLTLLVLAFLQNPYASSSILPSLNTLVKHADKTDRIICEDGVDCTFLRNPQKLPKTEKPNDSLESLLLQFFEYYASFNYSQKAICLNSGSAIPKPDPSPLYIVNPLERGLNVSKNVSLEELEKFKVELRNAAWQLESQNTSIDKTTNWGILKLYETIKQKRMQQFYQTIKPPRLMDVKELFSEEEIDNEGKIEYKNLNVKLEVKEIKKSTAEKIKQLENSHRNPAKMSRKSNLIKR